MRIKTDIFEGFERMRTAIKKWLGSTGLFNYCRYCGKDLWFDEEKYDLGHNVKSVCLRCTNPERFNI